MTRYVEKKVLSIEQSEGVGARVRRSLGTSQVRNFDPFLMLDEFRLSAPAGFPDHPHRGFETVTYMIKGSTEHEDFTGRRGVINPGDLQWMTAGRGILHSEMPGENCGECHGLQLWVNLSKKYKMVEPNYQELLDKDIPRTATPDGLIQVKIIAGESMSVKSPVYTRTPTMYLDFTLKPNSPVFTQEIPKGWNAFIYILNGQGEFGSKKTEADAHHALILSQNGDGIDFRNTGNNSDCRFVLIAGQPLNEPVVQHGPFVMNTQEEIRQTMKDFQLCQNGFENARDWQSKGIERSMVRH
ncbi:unnamed protein product [Adineta steineri]|uniref:Pirin n=1 Tax=Adineta steineri TaxID=433720 RepID=A0A814XGT6_9BILA|nr:unnamed protein product [Adineta steineri]